MKPQLLAIAAVLALATSADAQTLGDSVMAGNDNGATMVTDSLTESAAASAATDSTATTDLHPAGHSGLTTGSDTTDQSDTGSDDDYASATVSSTDDSASVEAGSDDSRSTDGSSTDASADDATSQGSAESASATGSSDASRAVLAAGVSVLAAAVTALL
ncbi:unnamed protein product [Phytophthora fragariaefolia]|uniref:Unnamed protein product n=1 Tax=Phytophthora fragariaefolia TaxID=1490495 RepID=A0A9W6XI49_9STRA|nr:unnamed protein product [Phytophthora fragariaefolia]